MPAGARAKDDLENTAPPSKRQCVDPGQERADTTERAPHPLAETSGDRPPRPNHPDKYRKVEKELYVIQHLGTEFANEDLREGWMKQEPYREDVIANKIRNGTMAPHAANAARWERGIFESRKAMNSSADNTHYLRFESCITMGNSVGSCINLLALRKKQSAPGCR